MKRVLMGLVLGLGVMACAGPGETGTEGEGAAALTSGNCEVLLAGQNTVVGQVCMSVAEGTAIYVEYELYSPWKLLETHTWIGTVENGYPKTKKGSPIPGQFPVVSGDISGLTYYVVEYPWAAIEGLQEPSCGQPVYIVTHAAVTTNVYSGDHETAWPYGDDLPGSNWAMGMVWNLDCGYVPPPPEEDCETAFAWEDTPYAATCFLDDGFGRWGWTNYLVGTAPTSFSLDLRAGAAHCGQGEYAGYVTFGYNADGTVTVTYYTAPGWTLHEAQFYTGDAKYPTKNGRDTVAPGQFPYSCDSVSPTGCTETVPSTLADWVIAHATVCRTAAPTY